MVTLRQDSRGNFKARKRIPDDVREDYGRLHGQNHEVFFFATANVGAQKARQQFREWDAEITGRFETIRATHSGRPIALTRQEARALAGDWYHWFVARHPLGNREQWEALRDRVHEGLKEAVGDAEWEANDPDNLWWGEEDLRKEIRPILADVGETAQFLAAKHLRLTRAAHDSFLDWLYDDLAAALKRLMRQVHGDYGDDEYAKRFPQFVHTDGGETPKELFDTWASEKKPARATVETWQYVFAAMADHFRDRSAASIKPDEASQWIKSLITPKRSAQTVDKTWLTASKTVFGWAKEQKRLGRNPFADVKVTVPRRVKLRDKAFKPEERRTILTAALAFANPHTPDQAARRWVPWLCAYTGARPGEITQLRGSDVVQEDEILALQLTPDAGEVKGGVARVVPIHEHLIEQGFLKFARGHASKPLFYRPVEKKDDKSPQQKKPRAVQARQRLASWVRTLGITDKGLSPLHAWRHTFKKQAARAGIEPGMRDAICGHSPRTVADEYEIPTLEEMADAMKRFPRYEV